MMLMFIAAFVEVVCGLFLFFLQKLAGNHNLLNFRSSFVNPERANISIKSFYYAAAYEAATAMYLNCTVDNSSRCFSRIQLRLTCFSRHSRGTSVLQICRSVYQ